MRRAKITVSQAIEGYMIAAQARRLSPQTLKDYSVTLRKLQTFFENDLPRGREAV